MALISCPQCGKEISEKAKVCPHCNLNLSPQSSNICEECGTEYVAHLNACPNCGCPNLIIEENKSKGKHKRKIILAMILILIVVLGVVVSQKVKVAEYYSNMEAVSYAMLDGAIKAETAGNLIKSVWNNAIYQEKDDETDKYTLENGKFVDDFNDALSNLFSDETFMSDISEIQNNKLEVNNFMKKLTDPPKKYEEAYSVLKVYYDNYLKLTKLVVNTTGSLNTFSDDFNKYDSETANSYDKMQMYLA